MKFVFVKDKSMPKKLNRLAREEMKMKILEDILIDMNICRLKGWDIFEYPKELIKLLKEICHENHYGNRKYKY